jgi:hypothetical protein
MTSCPLRKNKVLVAARARDWNLAKRKSVINENIDRPETLTPVQNGRGGEFSREKEGEIRTTRTNRT